MPLPGCLSADDKVDATIRQDRDVRALARDPAGRLDVVCNPDAGELAGTSLSSVAKDGRTVARGSA